MATVFEEDTTEEQRAVVRFSVGKKHNVKDINKEMLPVCRVKRFTTRSRKIILVAKVSLMTKRLK
jgi:hypothetical protein